jgi:hypothetical protein
MRELNLDWPRILAEVPKERRAQVKEEVEAAVREYRLAIDGGSSKGERERWRRIARLAKSKSVKKLHQEIDKPLDPLLPDPGFFEARAPARDWPQQLAYLLAWLPQLATATADLYRPRERLYARLCRAWGQPPVSAGGPFVRFVQETLGQIEPDGIDGETVRDAVERDRTRRRIGATASLSPSDYLRRCFEGEGSNEIN